MRGRRGTRTPKPVTAYLFSRQVPRPAGRLPGMTMIEWLNGRRRELEENDKMNRWGNDKMWQTLRHILSFYHPIILSFSPVRLTGFEPATPCLWDRCATSCATGPERSFGFRVQRFMSTSNPELRTLNFSCSPEGNRTPIFTLKEWCPKPLDDGTKKEGGNKRKGEGGIEPPASRSLVRRSTIELRSTPF